MEAVTYHPYGGEHPIDRRIVTGKNFIGYNNALAGVPLEKSA